MKITKHLVDQPFIAATGLAALVHSTWSLGTLFAGTQPDIHTDGLIPYLFWLVPALLIAFAMDVGQIATSAEIRAGHRTKSRYFTFGIFALATYYLQWVYIAHHMPALELAPGVRESWGGIAQLIRDSAIWVVPALLPLSTTLYTLSGGQAETPITAKPEPTESRAVVIIDQPTISEPEPLPLTYPVHCNCGWTGEYDTPQKAKAALSSHRRHCAEVHQEVRS